MNTLILLLHNTNKKSTILIIFVLCYVMLFHVDCKAFILMTFQQRHIFPISIPLCRSFHLPNNWELLLMVCTFVYKFICVYSLNSHQKLCYSQSNSTYVELSSSSTTSPKSCRKSCERDRNNSSFAKKRRNTKKKSSDVDDERK